MTYYAWQKLLHDLTGTGNAYTITVATGEVTETALNIVNAAMTVNVNATASTNIWASKHLKS